MSEWISVNEKYPTPDMDGMGLVVTIRNHLGDRVSETDAWHRYSREPNGGVFHFWGSKVTHWMPLPPPPAEGE